MRNSPPKKGTRGFLILKGIKRTIQIREEDGKGKEGSKVERRRKEKKGKERAVVITLVDRVGEEVIFHVAGSWEEPCLPFIASCT